MTISRLPQIKNLFSLPITLSNFADEIPIGILLLSSDRKILFINRYLEALTGFSNKEVTGVPCYHILRSQLCMRDCPVLKMSKTSGPVSCESDIINRERQLIPIHITSSPLKTFKGKLVGFIENIEDLRSIRELDANVNQAYSFAKLIGKSPQMQGLFQMLPTFAQSDSSVLITGETGTGKDMLAEALHQASNRTKSAFIKINCGALPETLLESELFGHKKGAFTGAVEDKPGRFKQAHNGTLYLTEIGDLPLALQVKLLTFLDDRIIFPLGSTKGFPTNVRIIAATHRNLEQMVKMGKFREDLLFRLNVLRLHLPPLRDRQEDIRLLIDHFLNTFTAQFKKNIKNFSEKALTLLLSYNYPGNIRELKNIIEYAINVCKDTKINIEHLPTYLSQQKKQHDINIEFSSQNDNQLLSKQYLNQNWTDMERQMIMEALIKTGGKKNKTADLLGWGRSTLWRKMKQYGINE